MKEKNYVVLNQDGTVEYVTEQRSQRNLTEDVINQISAKATRRLKDVFLSGEDPVGVICNDSQTFAYKFIKVLKINCTFKVTGETILRPIFINKDQKLESGDAYPQFVAEWLVPKDMKLMFAAKIKNDGANIYTDYNHGCMLIAWSGKSAYRLPLPNLYDNCDMCTGNFSGIGKSIQEAFAKAVEQMDKSEWNSDLLDGMRQRNADELFKFNPMPDGSMACIPYTGDWKALCPKAGNVNIELLAGAL